MDVKWSEVWRASRVSVRRQCYGLINRSREEAGFDSSGFYFLVLHVDFEALFCIIFTTTITTITTITPPPTPSLLPPHILQGCSLSGCVNRTDSGSIVDTKPLAERSGSQFHPTTGPFFWPPSSSYLQTHCSMRPLTSATDVSGRTSNATPPAACCLLPAQQRKEIMEPVQ